MSLLPHATLDKKTSDVIQQVLIHRRTIHSSLMIAVAVLMMAFPAPSFGQPTRDETRPVLSYPPIPTAQRMALMQIARDTWRFYGADVDPKTHLPMDNFGANGLGAYTSAANIGVYLWAVVAANDLELISRPEARSMIRATLTELQGLQRFDGFLYQWYDTTTGNVIPNPGLPACSVESGTTDNCSFISAVDNGWYASGLIVVRQAMPTATGPILGAARINVESTLQTS